MTTLNRQSFRDFEWVLVDDGSDDGSAPWFEAAQRLSDAPVTFIRLPRNGGQAEARNRGVAEARGDLIKFVDHDDALDDDHLRNLVAGHRALRDEKIIVFAPTRHVFVTTGAGFTNRAYEAIGDESTTQLAYFLHAAFLSHCGALFPRALLAELGPYDPSLATDEDGDLIIRTLLCGWRYQAVTASAYIYRHVAAPGRVSQDDTPDKLAARRRVCEKVIAWYADRGEAMPDTVRAGLSTRLDAIAVRGWRRNRAFSRDVLAGAVHLCPGYRRSGSALERALRAMFGLGPAIDAMALLRRARGRALP